jgi:cystathionine beta-lyase/cystathionine gamma-synthase
MSTNCWQQKKLTFSSPVSASTETKSDHVSARSICSSESKAAQSSALAETKKQNSEYSESEENLVFPQRQHNLVVNKNNRGEMIYGRFRHDGYDTVCQMFSVAYSTEQAVLFTSGMHTIYTTLYCSVIKLMRMSGAINLVYGNEMYCDSPRAIKYLAGEFSLPTHCIDAGKPDAIKTLFSGKLRNGLNIMFIESCTNPNGVMFDFSIIPELRKQSKQLILIVDNTWLTHELFNPFDHDTDLVVVSSSKHYSNGSCIGGAVIGPTKNIDTISTHARITGVHISPVHCNLILQNMGKIKGNIAKASETTEKIAQLLCQQKNIVNVNHPSLSSHKTHSLYKKYISQLYPSVLTIVVPFKKQKAVAMMKSFKQIKYETSFGGSHTKFDPWPVEFMDENNHTCTLCRLSIGYNSDYDTIAAELMRIFG